MAPSTSQLPNDPSWPRAGDWSPLDEAGDELDAVLVGIGTHTTSLSPTQAHATPRAVREALRRYSPHASGSTPLAALRIADAGDASDPDADEEGATALVARAAGRARLAIVLGGDNAATVPAALGSWGERIATAGLITIDAHHDLRDGRSNGSPVQRLLDAGLAGTRVAQIGIQEFANSRHYAERAEAAGIRVLSRGDLELQGVQEIAAQALQVAGAAGGPVHVDVDVDVCDRSVAPGCPASVPGGISAWQLRSLIRALVADDRVRSIDFTEVDATADTADGRTVRLVALGVLEALAALAGRERPVPRLRAV
ncbi:arginase family protein [Agrococcus sp. ARC_14]|uniref:arginase family protein n=1 Tax=Agrococcus sp. ARC_14 TaxID=2919927 RepID=UPI001F0539FA|nr:arginase family protein [Agrococcus sp. ARC_14]MCH1884164.1 arginase family protein [Agrococcus sp. ARC_14]